MESHISCIGRAPPEIHLAKNYRHIAAIALHIAAPYCIYRLMGSDTVTTVPPAGGQAISMVPPCRSTSRLAVEARVRCRDASS